MSSPTTKEILCLANSRKYGGRCIVGKEAMPDGSLTWVRPVSDMERGEVMPEDISYADGSMPQLLDVIEIPLSAHKPLSYQPENWLMAPGTWRKARVAPKANIDRWVDPPAPLWQNGYDSSEGVNDRFPYNTDQRLADSARFIRVSSLEVGVTERDKGPANVRRQLRGSFIHEDDRYSLRITDAGFEERHAHRPPGSFQLGACYLTVTVGEPFRAAGDRHQYHYKLIAAIIEA